MSTPGTPVQRTSTASELLPSYIRTFVPFLVGVLGAWLARQGFEIDSVVLMHALGAIIGYGYYVVVRFLEVGLSPKWGYILGTRKQPIYAKMPPSALISDSQGTRRVESPSHDDLGLGTLGTVGAVLAVIGIVMMLLAGAGFPVFWPGLACILIGLILLLADRPATPTGRL